MLHQNTVMSIQTMTTFNLSNNSEVNHIEMDISRILIKIILLNSPLYEPRREKTSF